MRAFWSKRVLDGKVESRAVGAPDLAKTQSVLHPPQLSDDSLLPHAEHPHRVDLPLHHLVNTAEATKLLMHHLRCDDWYVACRNEHLQVLRLTRKGVAQYAVSYRCTPDVEKAVFHGSKTWAVSVIPLHSKDELTQDEIREIKAVLEQASSADPLHHPARPES